MEARRSAVEGLIRPDLTLCHAGPAREEQIPQPRELGLLPDEHAAHRHDHVAIRETAHRIDELSVSSQR